MDINQAADAVERATLGFADAGGKKAVEVRVRPSGDDADAIKVWVDLGAGVDDAACERWGKALEEALATTAAGYTLEVRVESL